MGPVIAMPNTGTDLFRRYMNSKYTDSIRRAGGTVRWLRLEDPDAALEALALCDGLLLPGGPDLDPALYGQEPGPACGRSSPLRDRGEMALLKAFLPTGRPILCICRGMQLLNVFCGGTLHQDIPGHKHFPSRAKGCHGVDILPQSLLHRILATQQATVNSLHHQAADRVGPGLTASAVSGDGFVEALELSAHPFCLGVQWHPEHMSRESAAQMRIFQAFLDACRQA